MAQSLGINLFPWICLVLSFTFLVCLHVQKIARTLSRCRSSQRSQRWTYSQLRRQRFGVGTTSDDDEAVELSSSHPDSDTETSGEDGSSTQTRLPTTPLSKYFDPQTSTIYDFVLEPASPPTATWEQELQQRIDEGRGFGAWIDRIIDLAVRRFQSAMQQHA